MSEVAPWVALVRNWKILKS